MSIKETIEQLDLIHQKRFEMEDDEKKIALAKHLGLKEEEYGDINGSDNEYTYGREDYYVCTDGEANELCKDYILDSLWAFNPSFIASYCSGYEGSNKALIDSISQLQQKHCEDLTPIIKSMVGDNLDQFIDDAISSDGRGHFLSCYDGEEYEEGDYYIYRR